MYTLKLLLKALAKVSELLPYLGRDLVQRYGFGRLL
jgi:hypothetical protein